jgi:hypothetical protein
MSSLRAPPTVLRFDGAFHEGPLPPPPPGSCRVLGQTLSPEATRLYHAVTARWREQQAPGLALRPARDDATPPSPPWAAIISPLHGCLADDAAVLAALRQHLGLDEARGRYAVVRRASELTAPVRCVQHGAGPLPEDPPVHADVRVFTIDDDDECEALRGQARAPARRRSAIGARPFMRHLCMRLSASSLCAPRPDSGGILLDARSAACALPRRCAQAPLLGCCAATRWRAASGWR